MRSVEIRIDGITAHGFEIELPKAPLVLVKAKGGFVMCGYLNVEAAGKLGIAAAMVRGVSSVDDLLHAKVQKATEAALKKGVSVGMTGREALSRLS